MVEFLHVKPGKGAAFVRSKLKNLISGTTMEKTFRAGESVEEAVVIKMDMQFSYDDGEAYQFMNLETYETESVPKTAFSSNNQGSFLLEGMVVQVRTERVMTASSYPISTETESLWSITPCRTIKSAHLTMLSIIVSASQLAHLILPSFSSTTKTHTRMADNQVERAGH